MITQILLYCALITNITNIAARGDEVLFNAEEDKRRTVCKTKNKKQLKEVEDAQLAAHRCMIRDVAVKVPEPEDFIAEAVFPSHIVVPRCSGVCVSSSGFTCHPKKKPKIVAHDVVLYNVNGSQVCRKIELEHHKGPCRCSCQESQTDCTTDQIWSNTNCQCQCPPSQGPAKYQCARDPLRHWDDLFCSCRCRNSVGCPPGQNMDQETCQCQQEKKVSQCSVSPLYSVTTTSQTARIATYVGLLAIAMVTVTILATLYLMATKKRPYRDFRGESSPRSVSLMPQAAYSITINQPGQRSPSHPGTPLCHEEKTRM